MKNTTIVSALPVGELNTDLIRNEFDAIIRAFERFGADLVIAAPVSEEVEVRLFVQEFSTMNPDLLLIVPLRGLSAQLIEKTLRMCHAPCLIWPVQGNFALPSSALAVGSLQESRAPVELHYAPSDHPRSIERIPCIMRAAKAYSRLRESRIGVIGNLFPNLVSCRYDPQIVSTKLGTKIIPIPFDEIRNSIHFISQCIPEIEQSRQEITGSYIISGADLSAIDAGIKLHMALKQVAQENKLDGFAVDCWTGFPRELGLNPCMGFIDDAYTLACEGDVMSCVSLLMGRYLTGKAAYVGDLYDLDMDGILTLTHCGAPASLALDKNEVVLGKSQHAQDQGFETLTCRPHLYPGPVTLFRFYGWNCDKMHVALGELLSIEQSPNLTIKIRLAGNREIFLGQCFGNHYIAIAGDFLKELELLGKWLGITIIDT
jgi:L-fucose isomerase-like protein